MSIGKPAWIGLKMLQNEACSGFHCNDKAEWIGGLPYKHQLFTHFGANLNKPCFHVRPDATFETGVCGDKMPYICKSECPKGMKTKEVF